jgi:tetratricopeptide (TPR) repeat protein
MTDSRLDSFRAMVAKNPANVLARFGLANEAAKASLWEEAVEHYTVYLAGHDDEGNGWQRMAEALIRLGRDDAARGALHRGIEASRRFGHTGMAAELEERLEELGG